jgi:hypothetical protein
MKKTVLKITALSLFAAALVVAPAVTRAQDATNAPTATSEAPVKHKRSEHAAVPFNGKLTAIDTNAMTLTIGERTFEITSETKITKDGFPATLADGVAGEMTGGAYKKTADGKLSATIIHFGTKSEGTAKKKKKPAADSGTVTNSTAN